MNFPNRVSIGVPTGGQFARNSHSPSDITLDDSVPALGAGFVAEIPADEVTVNEQPAKDERPFRDYTPAQVDKEIVRISSKLHRAQDQAARYQGFMEQAEDYFKRGRISRQRLEERLPPLQLELDKYNDEIDLHYAELEPYSDEFRARGGWPRGWYVPAGHIHRSESCSQLRPTTQIGLIVELSGQSEDEIVAAAGECACTTCFPTAPSEVLNRPPSVQLPDRVEAERLRAERDAVKRVKEAKAAINTLSWGDRDPIYDNGSPILKVSDARSALQSSIFYGLRRNHFPLNIAAAGREVIEATYRINSEVADGESERLESRIESDWQHARKVMGLHRALVEKKIQLGDTEDAATAALNKSLISSMKRTYGVTPNVSILTQEQVGERQAWAAGVLRNRDLRHRP